MMYTLISNNIYDTRSLKGNDRNAVFRESEATGPCCCCCALIISLIRWIRKLAGLIGSRY